MNNFAILRSVDVSGNISPDELASYTQGVISKVQQTGKSVPPFLVMHVSERVAALVGVSQTGLIRHNFSASRELSAYYEIWLVGKVVFANYVLALQGIVEDLQDLSRPVADQETIGSEAMGS
jgi:hypothetical protein